MAVYFIVLYVITFVLYIIIFVRELFEEAE